MRRYRSPPADARRSLRVSRFAISSEPSSTRNSSSTASGPPAQCQRPGSNQQTAGAVVPVHAQLPEFEARSRAAQISVCHGRCWDCMNSSGTAHDSALWSSFLPGCRAVAGSGRPPPSAHATASRSILEHSRSAAPQLRIASQSQNCRGVDDARSLQRNLQGDPLCAFHVQLRREFQHEPCQLLPVGCCAVAGHRGFSASSTAQGKCHSLRAGHSSFSSSPGPRSSNARQRTAQSPADRAIAAISAAIIGAR